jgi:hypothetical protein
MTEMSAGIRALEMHERQVWHRERAQRENLGEIVDMAPRRKARRRTVRRAA